MVKFKTFRIVAAVMVVFGLFGFSRIACGPSEVQQSVSVAQNANNHNSPPPTPAYNPPPVQYTTSAQVTYVPVQQTQTPVYNPPPRASEPLPSTGLIFTPAVSTVELKTKLGTWLVTNQYRHGKKQWSDILPHESFKASVLRFKEEDAVKFSNNPGQWSQIKIDLNRDGVDDEKWLLNNGGLYKREVLDANGKVTYTEWFNK